jgi:hypothetical protein
MAVNSLMFEKYWVEKAVEMEIKSLRVPYKLKLPN